MKTKEEWKNIDGYEGLYQISNLGNVKSFPRPGTKTKNIRLLKLNKTKNGYLYVILSKNNKKTLKTIHRLVAIAFIQNVENKPQVNHIDGDKTNNCVNNLEWCNANYNVKHSYNNNLHIIKESQIQQMKEIGKKYGKLGTKKVYQYSKNNKLINIFNSLKEASYLTKINKGNISACCLGLRKFTGGYLWRYESKK